MSEAAGWSSLAGAPLNTPNLGDLSGLGEFAGAIVDSEAGARATSTRLRLLTSGAFEWYRYDALGRRVMVRTRRDHNCTSTECSSTITRFVSDGDQILYEIQAPGGAVATNELESDNFPGNQYGRVLYTHGAGNDQPLDIIRMGHNPPAGYGFEAWGGPYPIMPFGDWSGTLVGGTIKLPCPMANAWCTRRAPGTARSTTKMLGLRGGKKLFATVQIELLQ